MVDIEEVRQAARYLRWWDSPPLDQTPTVGLVASQAVKILVAFVEQEAGLGLPGLPPSVDQVEATELRQATQVRASRTLAELVRWLVDEPANWGWFEHYQPQAAATLAELVTYARGQRGRV